MKKIINRRRYDTETAEKVGEYEYGTFTDDFHYYREFLYKKVTGEFFLCGWGGALSPWAESLPDGSAPGEGIRPLDVADAQDWVEAHADADVYERLFGEVPE